MDHDSVDNRNVPSQNLLFGGFWLLLMISLFMWRCQRYVLQVYNFTIIIFFSLMSFTWYWLYNLSWRVNMILWKFFKFWWMILFFLCKCFIATTIKIED